VSESFVLKAKVHSAKVMDYEEIKTLLRRADRQFPRHSHLWLDAGYRGEDKNTDWVEKTLGWSVEFVERPRQAAPKEMLVAWAREWTKEGALGRISFRSMRRNPPDGIMDVADPLEKNASWQGGELLCQQRRTKPWYAASCKRMLRAI
jgi:hypothetical protein